MYHCPTGDDTPSGTCCKSIVKNAIWFACFYLFGPIADVFKRGVDASLASLLQNALAQCILFVVISVASTFLFISQK